MISPVERRELIRQKVVSGLEESFPVKSRNKTLELGDLRFDTKDYGPTQQKEAILRGDTLSESVKGTVRLRDKDGQVIDEVKNFTLARVPWFTPRHTLIIGGNEYSVSNQVRPKPGVYARKRANGILEANFNTKGGSNFNVSMDPAQGVPLMEYGSTKIPLYPILRKSGLSHEAIAESWGRELADDNAKKLLKYEDRAVDTLYRKVVPAYHYDPKLSSDQKIKSIYERYSKMHMDPEVNKRTLGKPYGTVTPDSILDASGKVLRIFRNADEVDDRDNLDFKAMHSVDDFFKEVVTLNARDIARKTAIKMEATPELRRVLPSGPFTPGLLKFVNTSQLAAVPTQTNPMELIDAAMRVTSLGEGGISTERAIPMEMRQTHVTQIGALDPFRTPESFRAGIDVRAAVLTKRDSKGNIYVPVRDVKNNKTIYVRAGELKSSVVAFPNQELKGTVDALVDGVVRKVPASKVRYQIPHPSVMYSPTTNLIPFMESLRGNRAVMGSKMQTQALSLVDREEPLVQVQSPTGKSFEHHMGTLMNPIAPVGGTVSKVDDEYVYIRPDKQGKTAARGDDTVKIPYEKYFPLAAKTHLNHDISVKPGDKVVAGQSLGESNFTRNGTLSLGKNMTVAYMPYYGANSNDAVVVSEGAAKKMTSERMYKIIIPRDPDVVFQKDKHRLYYGHAYTKDQYGVADPEGIVRPGTTINTGDPLAFSLRKSQMTADDLLLGRLHKSLVKPFREGSQIWDHDHPGEVVDVIKTPKRIAITVKTQEPLVVGDKLCYAEGTDVLTSSGWKECKAVTRDDLCYTLNHDGIIELQHPTDINHYPSGGEMYELISQQVELCVTINHNLYVKPRHADTFGLYEARNIIGKRVRHKKNGKWVAESPDYFYLPEVEFEESGKGCRKTQEAATRFSRIPLIAWARFFGAYLANGSVTIKTRTGRNDAKEYITTIHTVEGQKHSISGDQYTWIEKVITACNFQYTKAVDRYTISSKQLTLYLKQFGKADTKYIPKEFFTWGKDVAEALLDGLMGCDGHRTANNGYGYTTVSSRLADGVQRLALHVGQSANIYPYSAAQEGWKNGYRIGIVRTKNEPQINHGHARAQGGQEERLFESREPVFGITVPNHTLYVRRNGKPVWSGNSGRGGNKGVVSRIVPDDQMILDESGKPIDVILTSAGIVSRTNPGVILETAVGKVAAKTGKPILIENQSGKDNVKWVKDLLKKHGVKDKENVYDPVSGRTIPKVFVGKQYMFKLMKSTDTNYSARGVANYDMNQQPTKGGLQSAKAIGKMEFDALVGHNARNILRDVATIKSQKNDEFWRAVQLGYPTPPPKAAFAYDKLLNMMTGAGIHVHRQGNLLSVSPLTDKHIKEMSSGEIKEPKMVRAKDLKPESGGLFDPAITGGLAGNKWSHISLVEPVVNPVFKDPVRHLLGLTNPQLNSLLKEKGGEHIYKELSKINLDKKEEEVRKSAEKKTGSALDTTVKQLKYIRALKEQHLRPEDAYVISKIPVVPPVIRPVLPGKGGQELVYGDINPLYRDLLYVNNQFKEIKKSHLVPGEEERLRPALQEAVGAVFGTNDPVTAKSRARGHKGFLTYIAGTTSPKYGYFQSKIMKRSQDVSGRGTIVPDHTLGLDEVGIPEDMMWTMYEKFIIRRLVQNGYSALQASQMTKARNPLARDLLLRETKERPVIVNRAPTLHRYNMVAAYPQMTAGKTIRVHPFVEAGMNADYDGDSCSDIICVRINSPQARETLPLAINADYYLDTLQKLLDRSIPHGDYLLHIRDFPRIEGSKQVKDNKEIYDVPDGLFVFGYDPKDQKVLLRRVTQFSIHHNLNMVTVRTASGRMLEVSESDSLFGLNPATGKLERFSPSPFSDWAIPRPRKLERNVGAVQERLVTDKIFTSQQNKTNAPVHVVDDYFNLTSNFGWLLGAIVGDGWISYVPEGIYKGKDSFPHAQAIGLANIDKNIQNKFVETCQELVLGGKVKYKTYGNAHTWDGMKCKSQKTHVHNTALANALAYIFDYQRGAKNKRLPSFFVTAPREFLLGMFAGLLDTDGSVSCVKAKSKNKPQMIANYTTISPGLAKDVTTLALLLGVKTSITFYAKRESYHVTFSSPDLAKIANEIPCAHPRKRKLLAQMVTWDFSISENNSKDDLVPITAAQAQGIKKIWKTGHLKLRDRMSVDEVAEDMAHQSTYVSICKAQKLKRMSRATFDKVIAGLGRNKVEEILGKERFEIVTNPDLVWDFVEEVTPLPGKHTAWDLTVPDGNTFMTANQLIVYDTMMVHAPVTPKAVEEAKGMTLSNILFSDKSKSDLLVFPKHEAIMGLAHATQQDDKNKPVKFKTTSDAMKAYKAGKITLGTRVIIEKD